MTVGIINYGMGNIGSIRRALEFIGQPIRSVTTIKEASDCSHIILPGVGGFSQAMQRIRNDGIDELLSHTHEQGKPLLGICLGMQLLATTGLEGDETEGLGIVPAIVDRLATSDETFKIPHIGWNEIKLTIPSPLFEGIKDGTDFYFVHSYHVIVHNNAHAVTTTSHGVDFVSAVQNGNSFGVQFHPEKSSKAGIRLLKNFCGIA